MGGAASAIANPIGGRDVTATAVAHGGAGGGASGTGVGGAGGAASASAGASSATGGDVTANARAVGGASATAIGAARATATATVVEGGKAAALAEATGSSGQAEATAITAQGTSYLNRIKADATAPATSGEAVMQSNADTSELYAFGDAGGSASFALGTSEPDPTAVADELQTHPNLAAKFAGPSAVVFGAGVQGASYVAALGGTQEYANTLTFVLNPTSLGDLTLGLLDDQAQGAGFSSLVFTVSAGGATEVNQTFHSLADANAYFNDQALDFGPVSGVADLEVTVRLDVTMDAAGQGFANDFLLGSVPCFLPGTMIEGEGGEAAVEDLKIGDRVVAIDGDLRSLKPVRWIGRKALSPAALMADPLRAAPIRIRGGALAEAVPVRDLLVSPCHAFLVGGVLVQAGAMVNGTSIVRETRISRAVEYFHVELDDHSLILADGALAETFIDNADRMAFDNWDEHERLYPHGHVTDEAPYPRATSARQVPARIRDRLAARAVAIGAATAAAA